MASTFTPDELPNAVKALFLLNNFEVEGPLEIHGAEVDLCARLRSDPFAVPIYIEVTVEYVSNEKYGKDTTKFLLIREKDPDAKFIIVSSKGFSVPVRERAGQSRVKLLTYDELFHEFQKFGPYIDSVVSEGTVAEELSQLDSIYEEPSFSDALGNETATSYLNNWRTESSNDKRWLIILGEYGTGKTALTKILLRRWAKDHQQNPSLPIPLRIELRDFTRQFDARGLLHHFLDTNNLEYLSVDFFLSLIRSGRVILLLDGYDEMAQYMHARERRTCLEALAQLASGGAKGILTSRPNYFAEAEEFQVFEILYASLDNMHRIAKNTIEIVEAEKAIDNLLESQFISRYERVLQDLSPTQTESLVRRVLVHDNIACEVVLSILHSVFRSFDSDNTRALSGKPIIITYLLEVAEDLKDTSSTNINEHLSEWQIYELIIQKLMLRDFRRAPDILPQQRLSFLRSLSIWLSKKGNSSVAENDFVSLIRKEFSTELRRRLPDERKDEERRLFTDLRSSATLTRATEDKGGGWRFSHNSLREFLTTDYLLTRLENGNFNQESIPISDAMRIFAASQPENDRRRLLDSLGQYWHTRAQNGGIGQLLCLLWRSALSLYSDSKDPSRSILEHVSGSSLRCDNIILERIDISSQSMRCNLEFANFSQSTLTDINFASGNCSGANFSAALLDGVNFADANLEGADFSDSLLADIDFSGTSVTSANFINIESQQIRIVVSGQIFEGDIAKGYLAYWGANTDKIASIYKYQHHPLFPIAEKVAEKLIEGGLRQYLGLTQKGAAQSNPRFARAFVQLLIKEQFAQIPLDRDGLVEIMPIGRAVLIGLVSHKELHPKIELFLQNWRN